MGAQAVEEGQDFLFPEIPQKKYFTIGETAKLCGVKPHALRYWEQEFPQLKPVTRRGNRRYYQQHDIELIREIRALLYGEGFTIHGARQQLEQKKKRQKSQTKQATVMPLVEKTSAKPESDSYSNVHDELHTIRAELETLLHDLAA